MATLDNEIRLANLLIALGDGEQEIEANRERLSKLPEFDPYLLFKFLDRSSRGHLTCADLLVFFEEFGIIFSQDQVETIFTDNLPDKKLTFDQFMQLVVPIHHITTFDFHPSNLKRNNYSHEIALHLKHLLMSLLQKEIRLRITLEGLKGHLLEKSNSDFQGLFAAVDVYCQNVIDPDNLLQFMIKHRGSVSENQLLSIFRRINKKADACITFQEFVSFVCTSQMNHEKLLKKMSLVVLESRESAKKPLISPVVRHLENERRSKSPLLKEISMLSAKNIHKDFKNYSKGRISPVRASDNKSRGASPHSRSPVRPTPTLSARRENLVKSIKISQSHQVKSPGRQTTDKSHLDRRQLFKSEVEKLKIHPTHKQDAKKRTSPSPDYHSMRKGGYTPVLGTDKSASKKDLTVSTYLEQRRAEFKTQRSDSKPKTDQEFSPTRFHEREELENKGIHTEPTTKQVSRSLKYEETRPSDQVKPLKGRIIDPAFTSSGIENIAESHLSLEKRHVSKDSHKQSVVKGTSNLGSQREHARKRENDGSQTLIDSLTSIPETSSRVFQQPASDLKASDRQHPHLVQHVPAAVIQLTPTKLSDSLEAEHSSTTQRRIALREKYSKSPITTEAKRVESSHLVSGYHTGQSELSFSDRKTDELMAETPKFDSGIHQADTGARPSRHHLHASDVNVKTSDFEKLCIILKKIIVFYERIEEIKNQIHNEKDFSLAHHFSSFDFENKGYLTLNEFVQLFNSFGINIGRGEIVEYLKLILKKASIRPESRLTEADLAKCFAPLNAEGKLLLYSSTNSRQEGAGKYEVKPHLSAKLDEIVQLQIKLHCELIKEIKPIDPSMLPKLFKVLSENKAVASCEQITQFLKLNDVKFFENDVIFIFREFNCRQPKELHENEFLAFFRLYATAGL